MTKRRTYLAGAAVCVSALVALGTPAVSAAAATTAVTFTLTSGYLTVAQGDGTVAFDAASGVSVDQLGPVVIHDSRGGTLGWTASGTSNGGHGSRRGDGSRLQLWTGNHDGTRHGCEPRRNGAHLHAGRARHRHRGHRNNSVSWRPTVAVTRAPDAAARSYTATVTHSVL